MLRKVVIALSFCLVFAAGAFAQEYGRTSGGDLELITKGAKPLSGSISLGQGSGMKLFSGSVGGTLVADRIWFFASAAKSQHTISNQFSNLALPAAASSAASAKVNALLGDRQTLAAAFSSTRTDVPLATDTRLSAVNFDMHYTGIVSPNAFFSVSVSQHRAGVQ